jgi:hypothetical protein
MKTPTPPVVRVKGPAMTPRTPKPAKLMKPERIARIDAQALAKIPPGEPKPAPRPCPHCGKEIRSETGILCTGCWYLVPARLRAAWVAAILLFQSNHPVVLKILAWARPDDPPKAPSVPCALCKEPTDKPSRRALAAQLRSILPEGTPKKVRECAEFVSRRLDGLCDKCALSMAKALK